MKKGSSNAEFEKSLILRGWVRGPDGSLSAPSRASAGAVGGLGAGVRVEQAGPLDGASQAVTGGKGGVVDGGKGGVRKPRLRGTGVGSAIVTVCFVCIRPKRLDDDNLAGGCKSLRDGVAEWLGIDDGDPRVTWEYRQQVGKPSGVIVLIS